MGMMKPLSSATPLLAGWLENKHEQVWGEAQFRFVRRPPEIGEACLLFNGHEIIYCHRVSQNFIKTGNGHMPFANGRDVTWAEIGGGLTMSFSGYRAEDFVTIEFVEGEL